MAVKYDANARSGKLAGRYSGVPDRSFLCANGHLNVSHQQPEVCTICGARIDREVTPGRRPRRKEPAA